MRDALLSQRSLQGAVLLFLSSLILFFTTRTDLKAPDHVIIDESSFTDQVAPSQLPMRSNTNIALPTRDVVDTPQSWSRLNHDTGRYITDHELSSNTKYDGNVAHDQTHSEAPLYIPFDKHSEKHQFEWQPLNSSLLKRDGPGKWETARCNGERMWAKVQSAFDGHEPAGEVFPPTALDNGWTREEKQPSLDNEWMKYFNTEKVEPGKIPDRVDFIHFDQFHGFINRKGEQTGVSLPTSGLPPNPLHRGPQPSNGCYRTKSLYRT